MRATIILPIYNGHDYLRDNFDKVYGVSKRLGSSEVILAVDGSTDGSAELAAKLAKRKGVVALISEKRLRKGAAIKRAVKASKGRTVGFLDVDLSTPAEYIIGAVEKVESGYPIVIASRYARGAESHRTAVRLIPSLAYNALVRLLLGSKISDHQCGFKFWNAAYIKNDIPHIKDNHWFFDTEMLVRAQRNGVRVYELPVEWREGSHTNVHFGDIFYFLGQLGRMMAERD